ncbi:SGNH/GDSL hydrolase family protein [Pedobacter jejuensis]|uniref:GDSL family lipase n=1 Tax=Pedobacter jejuensis TaxID=1268550 RepID=A0A3N0C0L8_9SPHI|nr:SGNH/GDSL hydrolase family protein [Pedobacter jejuensis]RNL55810.1 GDSL family lipase [Pedobacter jejuensis]
MKFKFLFLLLISSSFAGKLYASNLQQTPDTLLATMLKPFGRSVLNKEKKLELISSAVHFGFKFNGESFKILATLNNKNEHNYLQYEIDGKYQTRIRVDGNNQKPILIEANGKGEHTVWIYKATEAHTGPILIQSIVANKIAAIEVPKAPLIEFIGNSITCGAASDASDFPCGTGSYHDQHNAYMAYGPRVARQIKANYILSSVSGIGIYRTWNMDGPSMPQVYEREDFQNNTVDKWDFKQYDPEIVSIALGTNDMSNGDGKTERKPFEPDVFINEYVKFIKLIKSKYPKAKIALLSSPMIHGAQKNLLEKSLLTIKAKVDSMYANDKKVSVFFFPEMQPHGCSGHPDVADHLILAKQLYPFFSKMIKNK